MSALAMLLFSTNNSTGAFFNILIAELLNHQDLWPHVQKAFGQSFDEFVISQLQLFISLSPTVVLGLLSDVEILKFIRRLRVGIVGQPMIHGSLLNQIFQTILDHGGADGREMSLKEIAAFSRGLSEAFDGAYNTDAARFRYFVSQRGGSYSNGRLTNDEHTKLEKHGWNPD